VYSGPPSDQLDHAIVIAGYGTHKDKTKFWLVKNSWGIKFGDKEGLCESEAGR
jgi:KDEL-tailed cysteine endopeptidase